MRRNLMIAGVVALTAAFAFGLVFATVSFTESKDVSVSPSPAGGPTPPPAPIPAQTAQANPPPRLTEEQIARATSIFENDGPTRSLFEGHPYSITSVYPIIEGDTGTLTGATIDVRLDRAEVLEGMFPTYDYLGDGNYKRSTRRLIVEGVERFAVYVDLREDAVVQISPEGVRNFKITEMP